MIGANAFKNTFVDTYHYQNSHKSYPEVKLDIFFPLSLERIEQDAFSISDAQGDDFSLNIEYAGTEEDWAKVYIASGNEIVMHPTKFWNRETPSAHTHSWQKQSVSWNGSFDQAPTKAVFTLVCKDDTSHTKNINATDIKVLSDNAALKSYTVTVTLDGQSFEDTVVFYPGEHIHQWEAINWVPDLNFYNGKGTVTAVFGCQDPSCDEVQEVEGSAEWRGNRSSSDGHVFITYDLSAKTPDADHTEHELYEWDEETVIHRNFKVDEATGAWIFGYTGQEADPVIPKETIMISIGALSGNKVISTLEFERGCWCGEIAQAALKDCSSLTSVIMPGGLEDIGKEAFRNDTALQYVFIPRSVTLIEKDAFADCGSIAEVVYEGTEREWNRIVIEKGNDAILSPRFSGEVNAGSFVIEEDSNHFSNSEASFFNENEIQNYFFRDSAYYDRLIRHCADGSELNLLLNLMEDEWGGSCHGIALTMGLLELRRIAFSDLSDSDIIRYHDLSDPRSDTKLFDVINYYMTSQKLYSMFGGISVKAKNSEIDWSDYGYISLSEVLKTLVEQTAGGKPVNLGYFFRSDIIGIGGHSVLAVNSRFDPERNVYLVTIYDENTASGEKGVETEYATDMVIAADYSSFHYDIPGYTVESLEEIWDSLDVLDLTKLPLHTENPVESEQASDTDTVRAADDDKVLINLALSGNVVVSNAEGQTLTVNNGDVSGSMILKDVDYFAADRASQITLTVPRSDKFTITGDNLDAAVITDDTMLSVDSKGASSAVFDLNNKTVSIKGVGYSFDALISVGEPGKATKITGDAKGETIITVEDGTVSVINANGLSNVDVERVDGNTSKDAEFKKSADGKTVEISVSGNQGGGDEPVVDKSGISIEGIEKSYIFAAAAIKPPVKVIDNDRGVELALGVDYTLIYSNNKNPGTATITVKGKGNYTGSNVTSSFTIAKPVAESGVSLAGSVKGFEKITGNYVYTGEAQYPAQIIVKTDAGNILLKSDGDGSYTAEGSKTVVISVVNNVNKGTATVAATGSDGKTKKTTFKIAAADLTSIRGTGDLAVDIEPGVYAIKGAAPGKLKLEYNGRKLVAGMDYTVKCSYSNKDKTGTGTVTIKGKGNLKGSISGSFKIEPLVLDEVSLAAYPGANAAKIKVTAVDGNGTSIPAGNFVVTSYQEGKMEAGQEINVDVRSKNAGISLVKGINIVVGTSDISKLKVTGLSGSGAYTVTYTGDPIDLTKLDTDPFESGKIRINGYTYGTDYVIAGYMNNTKKGTMTVILKGISSKCSGVKLVKVKIVAKTMVPAK